MWFYRKDLNELLLLENGGWIRVFPPTSGVLTYQVALIERIGMTGTGVMLFQGTEQQCNQVAEGLAGVLGLEGYVAEVVLNDGIPTVVTTKSVPNDAPVVEEAEEEPPVEEVQEEV